MPPIKLPIAEYAPDLPDYAGKGSANIRNVYPRTPLSYGPIGSPTPYSNALGSRCQGAVAFIDSAGNVYLFAGDATDLFLMKEGSNGWGNVSLSSGGYTVDPLAQWQFTYFNGTVIATDFADNPQAFTLGSSTAFADLLGSPPKGRYVATVKGAFVVFCNTFDSVNGAMPQRVWWSAAGNAGDGGWPTPGSALAAQLQSSATDLLGTGGWVQGIAADLANSDGVIFQEYAVKRMLYVGPPNVFDFLPAENARGCPAPYSIVTMGGIAYYLGQDGFYAFDGANSQPIGANRVDKAFWADLDQTNLSRVVGMADPINRLIWWAYPGAGSSQGNPNHLLIYNWQIDKWSICDLTCETVCRLLSIGYTLDQLFTVLGYTLDDLPAPLDSRTWTGGGQLLGIFDASHKLNYLTGASLAPRVDTQEMQIAPGRVSLITGARPLVDGGVPSVALAVRQRLVDPITFKSPSALNALGLCPQRSAGRYARASITEPAGALWTNISGVELDVVPQGIR